MYRCTIVYNVFRINRVSRIAKQVRATQVALNKEKDEILSALLAARSPRVSLSSSLLRVSNSPRPFPRLPPFAAFSLPFAEVIESSIAALQKEKRMKIETGG